MLANRLLMLLGGCCLSASVAWADEGFVDCSSHPKATEIFTKSRETTDAIGAIPCGERFTILQYGFIFTRVQTRDGKSGYIFSSLITVVGSATSGPQATDSVQAQRPASPAGVKATVSAAPPPVAPAPATSQPVSAPTPASQPAVQPAENTAGKESKWPLPVINNVFSSQATFEQGKQIVSPEYDPVLLLPIGPKLLLESKMGIGTNVLYDQDQWGHAVVAHGFKYLELDYFALPVLMISGGRFLTPFGIYRERLSPLWVRNLQQEPIIYAMNNNSSNGGLVSGAINLSSTVNLNYATYYSVPTNMMLMGSERQAGAHTSLFFPNKHFEIGASYEHNLSAGFDMVGGDVTWNLKIVPLDIRAEGLRNNLLGAGYWVEGAYRLNRFGSSPILRNKLLLRKSQVVLRGEQYMTPSVPQHVLVKLPSLDTRRMTLGWNYYATDGLRIDISFSRNFAIGQTRNIWVVGLTYRLTLGGIQ